MPGIYIHIPFCKSKCRYCNFFSRVTNNQQVIDNYVNSLIKEIQLQKNFLDTKKIDTVYFGGGTPTLLNIKQISQILTSIFQIFELNPNYEITLESNPENITKDYLADLKKFTTVNRISIGIQSFSDDNLKFLGRNHNSKTAIEAVKNAQNCGYENITGDLIFGLPEQSTEQWRKDLNTFFDLQIPHLSAYSLTIEENTVLGLWKKKKRIKEIDDEISLKMYETLINTAEKNNFLHYEISNFAKEGFIAKHNFSYWTGEKYIGIGASAHSFNGDERFWNIANIDEYINGVQKGIIPAEKEILTKKDKYNEFILTGLRTYLGINTTKLIDEYNEYFLKKNKLIKKYIDNEILEYFQNFLILTRKGKYISDSIFVELFAE